MEGFDRGVESMLSECSPSFPHCAFRPTDEDTKKAVLQTFFLVSGEAIVENNGNVFVSRAALSSKNPKELLDIVEKMGSAQSLDMHNLIEQNPTLAHKRELIKALAGRSDTTPGLRYSKGVGDDRSPLMPCLKHPGLVAGC